MLWRDHGSNLARNDSAPAEPGVGFKCYRPQDRYSWPRLHERPQELILPIYQMPQVWFRKSNIWPKSFWIAPIWLTLSRSATQELFISGSRTRMSTFRSRSRLESMLAVTGKLYLLRKVIIMISLNDTDIELSNSLQASDPLVPRSERILLGIGRADGVLR